MPFPPQEPTRLKWHPVNKNQNSLIRVCVKDGRNNILDMNDLDVSLSVLTKSSEWARCYEPKYGNFIYRHKRHGVITDTLNKKCFELMKCLKKTSLVKLDLNTPLTFPWNNQHQTKSGATFQVNDRNSWFDWYSDYWIILEFNILS